MSDVPYTRTLPYVLRARERRPGMLRLEIAKVSAVPDAHHVTIIQGAVTTTVARLKSYTPVVGEVCYLLTADTVILAIGTVA